MFMDENTGDLTVVATDDGLLIFGGPDAVAEFDELNRGPGGSPAGPLSLGMVSAAGALFSGMGSVQGASGRWVKLSPDDAAFLKANGIKDVTSGVIRAKDLPGMGNGGEILKHLKFEKAALLTPAAPAALGAMATQVAVESALADIQEYLKDIDAKLDRLLKQRKVESLGQLGGVRLAIDEAEAIREETGGISAVTWSKIQDNSLLLKTMQSEALAQLNSLAEDIGQHPGDVGKTRKALSNAREDVPFWLGILARTLELEERQYLLELARVTDDAPGQLEAHRSGIRIARAQRGRLIMHALTAINASVRSSAELTNFDRMANPIDSKKVTDGANEIAGGINEFADHLDAGRDAGLLLEHVPWHRATKAVIGDATTKVWSVGPGVANHMRGVGERIQDRRQAAALKKQRKRIGEAVGKRRMKSIDVPSAVEESGAAEDSEADA